MGEVGGHRRQRRCISTGLGSVAQGDHGSEAQEAEGQGQKGPGQRPPARCDADRLRRFDGSTLARAVTAGCVAGPHETMDRSTDTSTAAAPLPALAVVALAMLASAVIRRGGFYPVDAFGLAVVALPLGAVAVWRGRRDVLVVASGLGLALWWAVRSWSEHEPSAFLPLGASVLCFVAVFVVVRSLGDGDRQRVAQVVVTLGAGVAAVGMVGVLVGWSLTAQLIDGSWRLTGSMTYTGATAGLLVVTLLLALAVDGPWARTAVVLVVAGVLATRSPVELIGLAFGAPFVPLARWRAAVPTLVAGALAGLAVVAASAVPHRPVLVVLAALTTMAAVWAGAWATRGRAVAGAGMAVAVAALWLFHSAPTGRLADGHGGTPAQAWSVAVQAWRSSVFSGIGAPRLYNSHTPVGGYQGVVANGYLAVGAEGGVIGLLLLVVLGGAVVRTLRRRDVLSSCAVGAVVAFVVNGAVDYSWELAAIGVLGGCAAGLAAVPHDEQVPARPSPAVGLWVAAVVALVVTQVGIGNAAATTASSNVVAAPPPPSPTPEAPARTVATGGDLTDPFLLKVDGRSYLYTSSGNSYLNVPLRTRTAPGAWSAPRDVLPVLPGWAQGGSNWAPDVVRVSDGWMLYFTAYVRGSSPAIHCIGSAFGRTPSGPFFPAPQPLICQVDHRGSIDPRVYVDTDGRMVMLWKSDDNADPSVPGPDQGGDAGIWSQGLSADGRRLIGAPTVLLRPTEAWEGNIVEAPDMVKALGTYWLFFSGNWYFSPKYGIGVAACQSVQGPCSDPVPTPFIGTNLQGSGPGESSLYVEGGSVFLLYNPFRADDPGPLVPRPVVEVRLGFNLNGPYLAAFDR